MSRGAPDHVLLISRPENSNFDSSLTHFRSIDSKIPFTNAARVPHELVDWPRLHANTVRLCDRQNKLDTSPQISLALYFLVFLFDLWTRGYNREKTGRQRKTEALTFLKKEKKNDQKVRCTRDLESHARHLPIKSVKIIRNAYKLLLPVASTITCKTPWAWFVGVKDIS